MIKISETALPVLMKELSKHTAPTAVRIYLQPGG